MKARAQQKATEVSGELKTKVRDVTQGLSGKAGPAEGRGHQPLGRGRQAVTENGKTVLGAGQPVTKTITAAPGRATAQSVATQAGATVWRLPRSRSSSGPSGSQPPWASTGSRSRPPRSRARCCSAAGWFSAAAGAWLNRDTP